MLDVLLADIYYVSFGGNRYIPVWLPNHGKQEGIHPSPDMKCCYSVIKGLTVTQGVLDSHVGLLLVVLSVVRADTHVMGGRWQEACISGSNLPRTLWVCWPGSGRRRLHHLPRRPLSQEWQDAPSLRVIPTLAARSAAGSFVARLPRPAAAGSTGQSN